MEKRSAYLQLSKKYLDNVETFRLKGDSIVLKYAAQVTGMDDVWGTVRKVCCSPVSAELRDGPPTSRSPRKRRRITRKYEAARRNGHYTQSPEILDKDSTVESPPVTLSQVRRKLHFGRKPPKMRDNISDS